MVFSGGNRRETNDFYLSYVIVVKGVGSLSLMNSSVCLVFFFLYNNFLFALLKMRFCDFLVKMGKVVEGSYSIFFWESVTATEQGHSWSIIW